MDFKKAFISELKPAKYNPRKDLQPNDPEYQRIKKSIEEFGYVDPVIVNVDYTVIGGHQRLKVLKELGHAQIDVVVVDIPKNREKALNVALNKISGEWDTQRLTDLLGEIKADGLLDLTGFDDKEFDAMIRELHKDDEPQDSEPQISRAEELRKEWGTELGQMWQCGEHRVLCGDCTDPAVVARVMQGEKAEVLFTSPPYSDMRTYAEGTDVSIPKLIQFIPATTPHFNYAVINLGLQFKGGEVVEYWQDYIRAAKEAGLKFLAWNVWDKTQAGSIAQATNMFMLTHEWIFVFGAERKKLNRTVPNDLEQYASRHGKDFLEGLNAKRVRTKDGSMLETTSAAYTHHQLPSVLQQTPELSDKRKEHPAMFPVGLPLAYLEAMTDAGDSVLDPFLGSGTTMIACENLGRKARGIEIDPGYVAVCLQRYKDTFKKEPVLLEDAP